MTLETLKTARIDFEFYNTSEEILSLVCCSIETHEGVEEFWLHNDNKEKKKLKQRLIALNDQGYVFIAFQVTAEARSFYSLGLDPLSFDWIDLFIEYRHISNQNDHIMYGNQYDGKKVKFTRRPPPKWERTDLDDALAFKQKHSLVEAAFKLIGKKINSAHKDIMRDLILSAPDSFNRFQREKIIEYCTSDVAYLDKMLSKIFKEYQRLLSVHYNENQLIQEAMQRGKYAALTAIREAKGYPIDYEKTKNFSMHVDSILRDTMVEINSLFPDIKPFRWNHEEARFNFKQKEVKEWVRKNHNTKFWKQTDTGDVSLSLDAWTQHYNYSHDYPKNIFGAQMVRFLKLKQSLNGFVESRVKNSKSFWDSVGSDKLVRPYMNPFGSQTSRTQPSATSFIMLKPAWQRALIVPPKGYAITGIDYGSEEFFISALLSKDKNMIDAYLSGDPYLAFAKLVGGVPKDATKKSHGKERVPYKSTVLGLSYDMTKYGLSVKLTRDTGKTWTPDDAQHQIDSFYQAFPDFAEFKENILEEYESNKRLRLKDGWTLWGDQDNFRSVGNFPIQGAGAAIMRCADLLCHDRSLYVPITLHDALYILHRSDDLKAIDTAIDSMVEGFAWYFDDEYKDLARKIRLDPETWGPDFEGINRLTTPNGHKVKVETIHIDERAINDYRKFSKYFRPIEGEEFL